MLAVGCNLHLVVEGCMERENHLDLLGYHLCHLERHHHHAEAAGIEPEVVHTDAEAAAVGNSMEEVQGEEGVEESCIAAEPCCVESLVAAAERR